MAKTVYTEESIALQTGEEVVLRPLPIKQLKKFNAKLNDLRAEWQKEDGNEDDAMDLLVDLGGICIEKQYPEIAADRDKLEDSLDLQTIYKIIDVCGGLQLNDPNQQAAALAALNTTA